MRWDVDFGFGSAGPWLSWHPQASRDGSRPANVWTLRGTDGSVMTELPNRTGMVLDLDAIRLGWERSSGRAGTAPERRWSERFGASPGPDWKRCVSLPVALSKDRRATWEQSGTAVRIALDDLAKVINTDPEDRTGLLPRVRCTGHRVVRTKAGMTSVPELEILDWRPRPEILKEPANAVEDDESADGEALAPVETAARSGPPRSAEAEALRDCSTERAGSTVPAAKPGAATPAEHGTEPWDAGEAAIMRGEIGSDDAARGEQVNHAVAEGKAPDPPKPVKALKLRQTAKPAQPAKPPETAGEADPFD